MRDLLDPRVRIGRILADLKAGLPGVLASLVAHLLIALVLMLIIIHREVKDSAISLIGRFIGPEEVAPEVEETPLELPDISQPEASRPVPQARVKRTKRPVEPSVISPASVTVQGALTGRSAKAREDLVRTFGGTPDSEKAVQLGLEWLKRVQEKDGRWRLSEGRDKSDGPRYPDAGVVSLSTDTAATSLALLSYLGGGHTHRGGNYQKEVARGLEWLRQRQKSNGNLYEDDELGHQQSFYAHGQGAIALCEAYGMTHDESLLEPARKAIEYILESQHPVKGGWKYRPHSEGDLSVFGWQIMALQSARMAGLDVPEEALIRAAGFLDLVQLDQGARYRYEAVNEFRATPAMTAEGLLCRQYLGWPRDWPALRKGVEYISRPEHLPEWMEGRRNVYFWYYATQVLHNVQGEPWERWNAALQNAIVNSQVKTGSQSGSWHPTRPAGAHDEYADKAGRLYLTTLCILTLEVYYRHLPLYKEPAPEPSFE